VNRAAGPSRWTLNAGIAAELVVSPGAVEKHVAGIFAKLGLPPSDGDNWRVLAVLRYLGT
jgi:DNA-binding NarL/FixJ family response regulator